MPSTNEGNEGYKSQRRWFGEPTKAPTINIYDVDPTRKDFKTDGEALSNCAAIRYDMWELKQRQIFDQKYMVLHERIPGKCGKKFIDQPCIFCECSLWRTTNKKILRNPNGTSGKSC